MACPGPVFSRIVENAFTGEKGKIYSGTHGEDYRRMATSRCANLMAIAMVNHIDEAWISIQPVLTLYYMFQYFPTISRKLFPRFATPERMAKLREGNK
jgi:dehydrogenase/reductase SDR family protein 7